MHVLFERDQKRGTTAVVGTRPENVTKRIYTQRATVCDGRPNTYSSIEQQYGRG